MLRQLTRRLRRLSVRLGFERDWYLVIVAAFIGLVMAGVAILFILPLRLVEKSGEHASGPLLWWLVALVPALGATLAGAVHYYMAPHGRGPGVTKVMYAIYRRRAQLPAALGVRKWIASTLTIGSGGSAGAEGPIVTIGAVIGSTIGRRLQTSPQTMATLLGCGAAGGIAAVFNAPIAGVFFVLEILLRDFSLRTFAPIVIASVIAAAFSQSVLGGDPIFATPDDFSVGAFTLVEIPNYLVLGLLCGLAAAFFVRSLYASQSAFERLPVHPILRPAMGALLLGGLGVLYLAIAPILSGAANDGLPPFYGNGYPVIRELLQIDRYYVDGAHEQLRAAPTILLVLAAIGVMKALATCFTIGSGGAGGMFAPSLMMGATIGGTVGYVVNALDWFPAASPAHYALVGMGSMVAATTHAPLTSILIVYEVTRRYEIIMPLMLAAVISTVLARLVYRESVYTVKLTDQGVRVGMLSDLTILRHLSVKSVPLVPPTLVHREESAQRLVDLCEEHAVSDFVVVDELDQYVGLVTAEDLKAALVFREAVPLLQVNDLLRSDIPPIHLDETLDEVLDEFARRDTSSLPVAREDGQVLGLITRERLMRRYQRALTEEP